MVVGATLEMATCMPSVPTAGLAAGLEQMVDMKAAVVVALTASAVMSAMGQAVLCWACNESADVACAEHTESRVVVRLCSAMTSCTAGL